jgi:Membrane iron-sulfur containing protein FtrD-like
MVRSLKILEGKAFEYPRAKLNDQSIDFQGGRTMDRKYDPQGGIPREGDAGKGRKFFSGMGLGFLIMTLAGGLLFFSAGGAWAGNLAAEVTYPLKTFQDGKARFYEYKTPDGMTVKYFILKSSDGVVRAAFDACDVCWPEGKGYQQKGDYMVCRNCGRRFASVKVNVITGGCNPGALHREVLGDQLVIKVKDILDGKKYFNFAKRG